MKKGKEVLSLILLFLILPSIISQKAAANAPDLRVGYTTGFYRYQYEDENGNPAGFHIDVMNAIASSQLLSVEYVSYKSDAECYDALSKGKIDVILGAMPDIPAGYDFLKTDTLSNYTLCMIAKKSVSKEIEKNDSTAGYLATVERRHNALILSLANTPGNLSSNTFIAAASEDQILEWLSDGKADIAVCEKESMLYMLKERGISDEYSVVYNNIVGVDSVMLVRANDKYLSRFLDGGLPNIRVSGKYSALLDKWFNTNGLVLSKETVTYISIILLTIIGVILLYVFISQRVRKILEKKVVEKTKKLVDVSTVLADKMNRLENEGEIMESIIEDSPSGMIIIDSNYTILYMNRRALELSGFLEEVPVGDVLNNLPVFGNHLKIDSEIFKKDSPVTQPEIIEVTCKGQKRLYRYVFYNILDYKKVTAVLLAIEDVTIEEREKQEIFEAEKNKTLNTLIAGIAHEIKNPLTAIKTYTRLIPEQGINEEFIASFSKFVPKETERINDLVESLINYSRPARIGMSEVDIGKLLISSIGLTHSIAKEHGILIATDIDEDIYIYADRDHMHQALINYIMNAMEAACQKKARDSDAQVEVKIGLHEKNNGVIIEIYDNGIGMDKNEMERCMEPFFTTKSKGTGLGMAVAFQFVKESGGIVTVDSEKGVYTKIRIEFERYV